MLNRYNDCVVIPNTPDWGQAIHLKRFWDTRVATGVRGDEDRAAGRAAPLRRLEWTVLAAGLQERLLLGARI
ncbi:MAG: hypothetical protein WC718_19310, partial [Phycisphaerales bacterium]